MKKVSKDKKAKKTVKVDGEKANPRLDKFARGGHVKKPHKTQVNVIIGGSQKQPVPVPVPAPPMGGPPMPPPGMPMGAKPPGMKTGGKVAPKMAASAASGLGRLEKTAIQKSKK